MEEMEIYLAVLRSMKEEEAKEYLDNYVASLLSEEKWIYERRIERIIERIVERVS